MGLESRACSAASTAAGLVAGAAFGAAPFWDAPVLLALGFMATTMSNVRMCARAGQCGWESG